MKHNYPKKDKSPKGKKIVVKPGNSRKYPKKNDQINVPKGYVRKRRGL